MQQGLQTISIKKFAGMRNWENEQNIPQNNLFYAQNSELQGGRFRSSKGITQYLEALTGGIRTNGLLYYPHQVAGVTTHYLLQYYNKKWYLINTNNDTRVEIVGTTWSIDEDVGGYVYNNNAYVVSPNNGMAWLDGATWSTTFVGTPPPGSMIESTKEKLFVAGVPGAPAVIFYSRSATAAAPHYVRDWTDGSGSALIGKGGFITGLQSLKTTLYVFKNDSIYYLTGFDLSGAFPVPVFEPFSVTAGAINKHCVILVENDIWFLTPNLEIRSLGSAENFLGDPRTKDISLFVKRTLKELDPNQSMNATMSYFDKKVIIALRTAGSQINNFEFEYDYNEGDFSVNRMSSSRLFVATPTQRFFTEDGTSGLLFKKDSGYSKNGSSFSWTGKTWMWDLNRPDLQKRLRQIHIYLGRSVEQTVYIKLYRDFYNTTPAIYTLPPPSQAEIGSVFEPDGATWGDEVWGGSVWGGSGLSFAVSDEPTLYRKVFKIDINQTGMRFGIEPQATINGGLVELEQINFQFIVLPEKNKYVDI